MSGVSQEVPRCLATKPATANVINTSLANWNEYTGYAVGALVWYAVADPVTRFVFRCLVTVPASLPPSPNPPPAVRSGGTGSPLTVNASWALIASGEPTWTNIYTYQPGDVVSYASTNVEGALYMCLKQNQNTAPTVGASSVEWKLMSPPPPASVSSLAAGYGAAVSAPTGAVTVSVALPTQPFLTCAFGLPSNGRTYIPAVGQSEATRWSVLAASPLIDSVTGAVSFYTQWDITQGAWFIQLVTSSVGTPSATPVVFYVTRLVE